MGVLHSAAFIFMSYFKIYPRKIVIEPGNGPTRTGELFYHLEQYGHLHPDKQCAVVLTNEDDDTSSWKLSVLNPDIHIQKFTDFVTGLQFYLFQVLKYKPPELTASGSAAPASYFFQPVYFDMLDGRFKAVSETPDTASGPG
jgi:hypothetical protein